MKPLKKYCLIFILLSFWSAEAQDEVENQPARTRRLADKSMVRVVRWVSPVTGDFETLREDLHEDAQLQSLGYKTKIYQYSAYQTRPIGSNTTAVNRWIMPHCQGSIIIAEHELSDAQLISWGYKNKQFMFYAYKAKPTSGNFVSVSRWINAKSEGDPCRDFTLSVVETELSDVQLQSWGYKNKMTQFWVPQSDSVPTSSQNNPDNTHTIRIEDINEWLCPNDLTRGDREFDGNGPRIKTEAKLRIGDNGTTLYADVTFWAQETQHDWSTAEGRWTRKVYDAPYGKKIKRIASDQASRTQFISPRGGSEFLFPGHDIAKAVSGFFDDLGGVITKGVFALHGLPLHDLAGFSELITTVNIGGDKEVRVPAIEGTLVKFFTIVGDTGGGDISDDNNCNGDTRIVRIAFAPVEVEWER